MKKLTGLIVVLAAAFCASAMAQEFTSVEAIEKDGTYVDAFNIQGEYLWPAKNRAFQSLAAPTNSTSSDIKTVCRATAGTAAKPVSLLPPNLKTANSSLRPRK